MVTSITNDASITVVVNRKHYGDKVLSKFGRHAYTLVLGNSDNCSCYNAQDRISSLCSAHFVGGGTSNDDMLISCPIFLPTQ